MNNKRQKFGKCERILLMMESIINNLEDTLALGTLMSLEDLEIATIVIPFVTLKHKLTKQKKHFRCNSTGCH